MFSDNNRISHRQFLRQILLSFAGPYLLLVTKETAVRGVGGLLGLTAGFLLLAVWCFFLVRQEQLFRQMERTPGNPVVWLFRILYLTFLIGTGSCLLRLSSRICGKYLVSGIRPELLGLLLILVAGISMSGDVQRRGRMAEVLYPFVLPGFVLMLVLAAGQIRPEALGTAAHAGVSEIPIARVKGREIWDSVLLVLCAGAPLGLLPWLLPRVEKRGSAIRPLFTALLKLFCLTAAGSIVLLGVFGVGGLGAQEDPMLLLMGAANLPGGFVERFDSIWMALLLTAFLFSLASVLFYGEQVIPCRERTGRRLRLGVGILVWFFSVWPAGNYRVSSWYGSLVLCLYLPAFVLLPVLFSLFPRLRGRKASPAVILLFLLGTSAVLASCGVEPEKRAYPLAISIDYRDGAYQLLYAMADLPVLTGQEKSGEGTEEGEDSGKGPISYQGKTLEEIGALYDSTQEFQLDTGHVQAILLGKGLLADADAYGEALDYLSGDSTLGRQSYVFSADNPEEVMALNGKEKDSIGEYLTGMYDNREVPDRTPVTLDDLLFAWYNGGGLPRIPAVGCAGEQIYLE